jgi:hypothetical protein
MDYAADPDTALDAEAEPVPALTFLGVTQARLVEITQQATARIKECLSERGQDSGVPLGREGSWLYDRQVARISYKGNMEHRKALGSIFLENNWTLNTPARYVRLLAAHHATNLVGSEPFCAIMPAKIEDQGAAAMAKAVEAKAQRELSLSNIRPTLIESIRVALCEGERPVKVTWTEDKTEFIGPETVMVSGGVPTVFNALGKELGPRPEGYELGEGETVQNLGAEPVKTPNGQYIFPKDDTITVVVNEAGEFLRAAETDPTGSPIGPFAPGEAVQVRLKKEPAFIFTSTPVYQLVPNLRQTIVHKRGVDVAGLFCEDFIYPLQCASLAHADIMVHVYDEALDNLRAEYKQAGFTGELQASGEVSRANEPIYETGETERTNVARPLIKVHETYFRLRVNPEDALESWIFLVIDAQLGECLFAEYLGNMKLKRPPFVLLRGLESEPGRAYGTGIYKKFADKNLAIDMWFNRAALKSSKNASITVLHKDGLIETRDGQPLVFGGTQVYTAPEGSEYDQSNPPVYRINLAELGDNDIELMEKLIQSGELEFGIVSAAGGSANNLNASDSATGVRNIERTGNTLQEATENLMATDISEVLELAVAAIFENMDGEEMQWEEGTKRLATMNREEIRSLPREVRLLLTKSRSAESIETNTQAKATILEYYSLPKVMQKRVRFAFLNLLKDYDVPDADEVLTEPTAEEIAAEAQAASNGQPEPVRATLSLNDLDGLMPSERSQILEKYFGIKGATPDELMQQRQNVALFKQATEPQQPKEAAVA